MHVDLGWLLNEGNTNFGRVGKIRVVSVWLTNCYVVILINGQHCELFPCLSVRFPSDFQPYPHHFHSHIRHRDICQAFLR